MSYLDADNSIMVFGDAKDMLQQLSKDLKDYNFPYIFFNNEGEYKLILASLPFFIFSQNYDPETGEIIEKILMLTTKF